MAPTDPEEPNATVRRCTNHVTNIADKLQKQYDAEHDLIPGAPKVTATEFDLLYAVINLNTAVVAINEQIKLLNEASMLTTKSLTVIEKWMEGKTE